MKELKKVNETEKIVCGSIDIFYPLNTLNENNQKKMETKSGKEETKNKTMELRMVQMTKNGKYKNSENFLHKNMRLSITYTHRNNTHKHID